MPLVGTHSRVGELGGALLDEGGMAHRNGRVLAFSCFFLAWWSGETSFLFRAVLMRHGTWGPGALGYATLYICQYMPYMRRS